MDRKTLVAFFLVVAFLAATPSLAHAQDNWASRSLMERTVLCLNQQGPCGKAVLDFLAQFAGKPGKDGRPGRDGKTPTATELVAIIKATIERGELKLPAGQIDEAKLREIVSRLVAEELRRQPQQAALVPAPEATPTPAPAVVPPAAPSPRVWTLPDWFGWVLLAALILALLWWLTRPRIWNRVRGLRAGEEFGSAEAHARMLPGVDSRITKEVSNKSRERPGARRYRPWVFARRGHTLAWRIGWHNDEWMPVASSEVQFQDVIGPGHVFVPGSGRLSIGRGQLIHVPDHLITGGQVFSLADIPGAPTELPQQSSVFLYFDTRTSYNGHAGQAQNGQQAQGHHGHDPDAVR